MHTHVVPTSSTVSCDSLLLLQSVTNTPSDMLCVLASKTTVNRSRSQVWHSAVVHGNKCSHCKNAARQGEQFVWCTACSLGHLLTLFICWAWVYACFCVQHEAAAALGATMA